MFVIQVPKCHECKEMFKTPYIIKFKKDEIIHLCAQKCFDLYMIRCVLNKKLPPILKYCSGSVNILDFMKETNNREKK